MSLLGRIASIKPISKELTTQFQTLCNGDFPPRYKPTFARHRPDRITDLWKTHFDSLELTYIPPPPFGIVNIPTGMKLMSVTASCFGDTKPHQLLYLSIEKDKEIDYSKLLSEDTEKSQWGSFVVVEKEEKVSLFPSFSLSLTKSLDGPCTVLLASDIRIGWQGILEKSA